MVRGQQRVVEVNLDDRWFLPLPAEGDVLAWARECVATLQSEPGREPEDTVTALVEMTRSADPDAVATLLFCPDGLPGRALVAVYATESDLETLHDLPEAAPATIPRQVLPLRGHDPATGRVVSTVTQVAEVGILGTLQYELLRAGALIEVVATSPSLEHLGRGMPAFEELIERIVVDPTEEAGHVPA